MTRGCCERYFPIGRTILQPFSAADRLCEKGDLRGALCATDVPCRVTHCRRERARSMKERPSRENRISVRWIAERLCSGRGLLLFTSRVPIRTNGSARCNSDTFVRLRALTCSQRKLAGVTMHLEAISSEKSGVSLPDKPLMSYRWPERSLNQSSAQIVRRCLTRFNLALSAKFLNF